MRVSLTCGGKTKTYHTSIAYRYMRQQHWHYTVAYGSCYCRAEGVDKIEGSLCSGYPWGVHTSTAKRTDGWPTRQYDLLTQPLQYQCLYFSHHICYCLILKKKVAEQRIMKSKPNTHNQEAPGKKHTVSILISLTESRNMASVTHHLPSLLSFCRVEKDGEEVVLVGVQRGKLLEIEDMDRKGHRTLGFSRNFVVFVLLHLMGHAYGTFKPWVK